MKVTRVEVVPDASSDARANANLSQYCAAANWLAGEVFASQNTNKVKLRQLHYAGICSRFGLSPDMAVRCIDEVVEAYKRDRQVRPVFAVVERLG